MLGRVHVQNGHVHVSRVHVHVARVHVHVARACDTCACACENVDVHEILQKPIENQQKCPPGAPPKRPKIDPSRSQEVSFPLFNFDLVFESTLVPFWFPKCLPLGTLLASKIDQKNDPKSDCLEGRSKIAPRAPSRDAPPLR